MLMLTSPMLGAKEPDVSFGDIVGVRHAKRKSHSLIVLPLPFKGSTHHNVPRP